MAGCERPTSSCRDTSGAASILGAGRLTRAGSVDIYVAKFDAAGNHLWSQRFGDAARVSTQPRVKERSKNNLETRAVKCLVRLWSGCHLGSRVARVVVLPENPDHQ